MPDHVIPITLSDAEMAQLEKLAHHEERDPIEMLKVLALGGLAAARERHRAAEIMTSGRGKRNTTLIPKREN